MLNVVVFSSFLFFSFALVISPQYATAWKWQYDSTKPANQLNMYRYWYRSNCDSRLYQRLPVTLPHGNFATVTSPHGNFAALSYIENLHCIHRNKTLNSRLLLKILSGFWSYLVTSPHNRNCGEGGVGECMG